MPFNGAEQVSIQDETIYGWPGIRMSVGDVSLGVTPQIGGRIISLTYQGEELFFHQLEHEGEVIDLCKVTDLRQKKRDLGFRLWGGDKTWIAPQKEWWERIPPLDLDAGCYDCETGRSHVRMVSPVCRETGLQVIRRVALEQDGSICLDETLCNAGRAVMERGIWNVTQVLRPFEVYLPAPKSHFRAYKDEGLVEDAQSKISEQGGRTKIACLDATHFKFGGMVDQGRIDAVRTVNGKTVSFSRTFDINPKATYAHGAMVEVYNSPRYGYLEIEVHAPLTVLKKGEEVSLRQVWRVGDRASIGL